MSWNIHDDVYWTEEQKTEFESKEVEPQPEYCEQQPIGMPLGCGTGFCGSCGFKPRPEIEPQHQEHERAEIDKRDKRITDLQDTCSQWERLSKEIVQAEKLRIKQEIENLFGWLTGKWKDEDKVMGIRWNRWQEFWKKELGGS